MYRPVITFGVTWMIGILVLTIYLTQINAL